MPPSGPQPLAWQVGLARLRRLPAALGPTADVLIFVALTQAGLSLGPAHMLSFAAGGLLNYLLGVRRALSAVGREWDLRLHGQLLAVSLLALFFRGGVLALLTDTWGWPSQVAIVFAVLTSVGITQWGYGLALSPGVWRIGDARWRVLAWSIVGCALLLRLVYIAQVQLLPEETYYWNYSQHLDIGYLDHPPMVAWLIHLGTIMFGNTGLGVRMGALCSAVVASWFAYRLTRNLFGEASALVALVLMQVLPFLFLAGMLMTPDAPLTAAWAASLYFLERALLGGRSREWWFAGASVGLGLLSKYTIGLLVAATFVFLLADPPSRRWLARWQPYAAMALALVLFAPVIVWNAHHGWASFAFQTARRLADTPQFALHKLLGSALVLLTPTGVVTLAIAACGRAPVAQEGNASRELPRRWRFIQAAVLTPLAVFVLFSLRHEVKLDWTGALWVGVVPALAFCIVSFGSGTATRPRAAVRAVWLPTIVVLLAVYAAGLHYLVLGLPGLGYSTHVELVPVVWRDLGRQVAARAAEIRKETGREPLVVGMDRYMIASELAFYTMDERPSVSETASRNLFGLDGLMYEQWFPPARERGRTLLLVGWDPEDLSGPQIGGRAARLGPLQQGTLWRGAIFVRHYYYRAAYGFADQVASAGLPVR
ncbi:MAG TPA: glycosyltransferase family 39 protein [Steroidobacteraceae bacterium]|nr:glycosyltransferase family 39 protein [Steroidobacteraceae bacterium]